MSTLTVSDESGKVVGYFVPAAEHERVKRLEEEHRRLLYAWANEQFSDEDIDAAEREHEEFTTAEILKYLESL